MKFTEIKLIEPIQKALKKIEYITATPIQEKSIPKILEGKDLFGIAQTGTGKTAAFILPIIQLMYNNKLNSNNKNIKTLILAPTRELAAQIADNVKEYASFTNFKHTVIFGGVSQQPQEKALSRGVDILIATPGRLLDLLNQRIINLSHIEYFILDEADRMLDMGFINDIKKIIKQIPKQRQSLFFSATMSKTISNLAKDFLNNPIRVEVSPESTTIKKIDQGLYFIDRENKDNLLLDIIKSNNIKTALCFTRTKHKSNKIAKFLTQKGIPAEAIHGNKSQNQRTKALNDFKSGKLKVLVATEIVARGIDIDNISHVINYEIPNEPESYVHRIGRTARAGTSGIAYSFCSADERDYIREIEKLIKTKIPVIKHDKHSEFAQNATGKDAKPIPKSQQHSRKGSSNKKPTQNHKNNNEITKKYNSNKNKSKGNFKNKGYSRRKHGEDKGMSNDENSRKTAQENKSRSKTSSNTGHNSNSNYRRK